MNPLLWWMFQTSAAVAILVLFVSVACVALKNRPAWRHALWLVVLIKFITPPIVSWPWSLGEIADRVVTVDSCVEVNTTEDWRGVDIEVDDEWSHSSPQLSAKPPFPDQPGDGQRLEIPNSVPAYPSLRVTDSTIPAPETSIWSMAERVLLAQWLFISFLVTGTVVVFLFQLRRLLRQRAVVARAGDATESLVKSTNHIARQLKVSPVPVRTSDEIASPFLWCFGWLRLVWPVVLTNESDLSRSRGIIAHELAHLRRRDHWVAWLELGAGIIWWWNPLFWFVRRQLRESAEMACDAIALSVYDDRRAYAEMFLELSSSFKTGMPAPALGVSTGTPSSFERRLTMILNERVSGKLPVWGFLLMGTIAAVSLPGWSLAQSTTDNEQRAEYDELAPANAQSIGAFSNDIGQQPSIADHHNTLSLQTPAVDPRVTHGNTEPIRWKLDAVSKIRSSTKLYEGENAKWETSKASAPKVSGIVFEAQPHQQELKDIRARANMLALQLEASKGEHSPATDQAGRKAATARTQLDETAIQVLQSWKSNASEFDQFECRFTCWKFDRSTVPDQVHASWQQGEFRYANAGQFIYRIDKLLFYAGMIDGKPKYSKQHGASKDYLVCNGTQWLDIDIDTQKCITTEVPDAASAERLFKETWLCPLLPVVSMSAAELQQRYYLRLVKTHYPDLIVIEARPKKQEAASSSYGLLQIVLERQTRELSAIILCPLNHDAQFEHYEFKNLKRMKNQDSEKVDFVETVRVGLPATMQFGP